MTNQEKELIEIFESHYGYKFHKEYFLKMAQAIIAKYPSILAEKVFEDDASIVDGEYLNEWLNKYEENTVQIFIREVK